MHAAEGTEYPPRPKEPSHLTDRIHNWLDDRFGPAGRVKRDEKKRDEKQRQTLIKLIEEKQAEFSKKPGFIPFEEWTQEEKNIVFAVYGNKN